MPAPAHGYTAGDPLSCLNMDKDLTRLKKDTAQKGFLEGKIKEYFLDNPHRVLFTLAPDTNMEAVESKRVKKELADVQSRLTQEDLKKIQIDAETLKALQETEEDLSVLPTLALEDIPPDIEIIRPDHINKTTATTCYNKATSDILYFTCPVVPRDLPESMLPVDPLFLHGIHRHRNSQAGLCRPCIPGGPLHRRHRTFSFFRQRL